VAPPSRQPVSGAGGVQKQKSSEFADNYNDDFDEDEEIMEDIPENNHNDDTDNNMMLGGSGNNFGGGANLLGVNQHRSTIISESAGGITVS